MDYESYIPTLVNALIPIFVAAMTALLTWVAKKSTDLINAKLSEAEQKKIQETAESVWNIVEEYYRLHPELKSELDAKAQMFNTLLKSKLPGLTDEDIDELRQAIAGKINANKVIQEVTTVQEATSTAETPVVVAAVKYVAPDGTELQPVTTTPPTQ